MARSSLNTNALSLTQARRIALHAQGFRQQDTSKKVTWAALAKTIDDLHLLQIDSVNVLSRSHYLPLFSRLGGYAHETLDKRTLAPKNRHVFECWAHEASFVPMRLHPLMRWRMQRALNGKGKYSGMSAFNKENKAFLGDTLKFIANNGPVYASDVPGGGKSSGGWWGWSKGKFALETLFDQGLITAACRDGFERLYDITERVIPSDVLSLQTPTEVDTFKTLTDMAGQALGIGTAFDLRDYFRLPVEEAKKALNENIEDGTLIPVHVEGWKAQAYLHRDAKLVKAAGGNALLSPFDPLVWFRERTERLFNFHYRIEIYTPESKRKFGYYVLPFLHGEKLVGRLCLKADRENKVLKANQAHIEAGCDPAATSAAMAEQLKLMASWLQLSDVEVGRKGKLSNDLRKQI
jgi:uncharacterized protein